MKIIKKTHLFWCAQIIFLGAVAPALAMSNVEWSWDSDKEYTDEEYQEMFQSKNIKFIHSSCASKTVENFKKKMELQKASASAADSAWNRQSCNAAPAPEKPKKESNIQGEVADKKYEEAVRTAGLREIDPSSESARRGKAKADLLLRALFSNSDSASDGEDSDESGQDGVRAEQRDAQSKFVPDQKNKNCCYRVWVCLNRVLSSGSPVKNKGAAPTLGERLNQLWD